MGKLVTDMGGGAMWASVLVWLVVSHGGSPAQIAIIDLIEDHSVAPMTLSGTGAQHNAMSQSGRFLYVAILGTTPGVAVVDMTTQAVVATYAYSGGGSPHGVFYESAQLCQLVSSRDVSPRQPEVPPSSGCSLGFRTINER